MGFRDPETFTGSMGPKSMLLGAFNKQEPQRPGRRNRGKNDFSEN
jgi:hypothetical protein